MSTQQISEEEKAYNISYEALFKYYNDNDIAVHRAYPEFIKDEDYDKFMFELRREEYRHFVKNNSYQEILDFFDNELDLDAYGGEFTFSVNLKHYNKYDDMKLDNVLFISIEGCTDEHFENILSLVQRCSNAKILKYRRNFDIEFPICLTSIDFVDIDISDNDFSVIPECFVKFQKCSILKFSENEIRDINFLSKLPKLKVCDCSHNNIYELPIEPMFYLKNFNCSHNHIEKLTDAFIDSVHIETFNISHNPLKLLHDNFGRLYQLRKFYFEHTLLTDLPTSIKALKFEVLKYDGTRLQEMIQVYKSFHF